MKKVNKNAVLMHLMKGRTLFVLLILVIFFAVKSPAFLSLSSVISVMRHVALYGILGIGMTYVIITGGIDLSVGSVAGLTGMVAGGLIFEGLTILPLGVTVYFNVPSIILISLALGCL